MTHATQSHDGEELISISRAARALGLSVSTLSRPVKAGWIRSHEGRVRLREVIEDRRRWVDPARRKPDRKPAALAYGFEDGVIALARALVAQMGLVLAQAAVICGVPMRVVAALHVEAGVDLSMLIDHLASELVGRQIEIELTEAVEPDWHALAAAAGELYDDEAWEAYKFERLDTPGSPRARKLATAGIGARHEG